MPTEVGTPGGLGVRYPVAAMPSMPVRHSVLRDARRVVVKVGTQLITTAGGLDEAFIGHMAEQIAEVRAGGVEVTLVSSGAIGAGCVELGRRDRPTELADQQAIAAVGQRRLMTAWHDALAPHRVPVGQVLLTRGDFDDRGRFLNLRSCITRLHEMGCLPVLNENDSVSVDELRFGDNDQLAALVCNAMRAEVLVLLTTVDGLLDASGGVVDHVGGIEEGQMHVRRGAGSKSAWGSGGMASKLDAAARVTGGGEVAVIASGRVERVLPRLLSGERLGTLFAPAARKLDSRRRWIGLTARPTGSLSVDPGAALAVTRGGSSLLAKGITHLQGRFVRGDVVSVLAPDGREIARGLTHYDADDLARIMGQHSHEIPHILGREADTSVIHRDHLVLMEPNPPQLNRPPAEITR